MLRVRFTIKSRIRYTTAFGRIPSLSVTASTIPIGSPIRYPKKVESNVIYKVAAVPSNSMFLIVSSNNGIHLLYSEIFFFEVCNHSIRDLFLLRKL